MEFRPIGRIHSPFKTPEEMPVQPAGAAGVVGTIELDPALAEGLVDLDGFSHLIVLYHFHRAAPARLTVTPFLDPAPHGVFATRAPTRPNPIGLSILALKGIAGAVLTVEGVDILDGTPLLDIKPYVPHFDRPAGEIRTGWLESSAGSVNSTRADNRFVPER